MQISGRLEGNAAGWWGKVAERGGTEKNEVCVIEVLDSKILDEHSFFLEKRELNHFFPIKILYYYFIKHTKDNKINSSLS